MNPRITISIPCYKRPQRTIRAIECIANQNIDGWEALIGGDCCPVLEEFINKGQFDETVKQCASRGNILDIINYKENKGCCGYSITNSNIQRAKGEYFVFYANDDVILPNHFENYLSAIEGTDYDFMYFDSYVEPYKSDRISELRYGGIGHSELIVRTSFLKKMPPHSANYGHDWELIQNMLNAGAKYAKAISRPQTYIVKSVPNNLEQGID
jgi:GT2 family glycosyltransferase